MQDELYIRVKQALTWLKRNKQIKQKDIAEKMGMAEASFTRALARIKEKNDEDFVISFHSVVSDFISLDYLLHGTGDMLAGNLHQPIENVATPPTDETTADLVELYAQRIRLVDDLRQSLKEELAELRNIKEDMHIAVNDFRDATYRLNMALKSLNEQRPPSIGIAADEGDY